MACCGKFHQTCKIPNDSPNRHLDGARSNRAPCLRPTAIRCPESPANTTIRHRQKQLRPWPNSSSPTDVSPPNYAQTGIQLQSWDCAQYRRCPTDLRSRPAGRVRSPTELGLTQTESGRQKGKGVQSVSWIKAQDTVNRLRISHDVLRQIDGARQNQTHVSPVACTTRDLAQETDQAKTSEVRPLGRAATTAIPARPGGRGTGAARRRRG